MKQLLIITFIFFINNTVNARKVDSEIVSKADSLLSLSYQKVLKTDPVSSLEYAHKALILSESANYQRGIAIAQYRLGDAFQNLGEYNESLQYLSLAANSEYTKKYPELAAEIFRTRGRVYGYMKLNHASIKEFNKGLNKIKKVKDKNNRKFLLYQAYENLSKVYGNIDKRDSVNYYLHKSYAILKESDEEFNFHNWINFYCNKSEHYINIQKYDSVEYFLKSAVKLSDIYNYPYVSKAYMLWGDLKQSIHDYDTALNYYHISQSNLKRFSLIHEFPELYRKIAMIHRYIGNIDSVMYYNELALEIENDLTKKNSEAVEYAIKLLLKDNVKERSKNSIYVLLLILIIVTISFITYYIYHQNWWMNIKNSILLKEIEKKNLRIKMNESLNALSKLAQDNDPTFLTRFIEIYPEFYHNLKDKHPNLVNSEVVLCAMIYLNFPSKKIAQCTFIEHRSVQTKKGRLRKKLKLKPYEDIYHYLKSI